MFRFLITIIFLSVFVYANSTSIFKNFFEHSEKYRVNRIKLINLKVLSKKSVKEFSGWKFYRLLLTIKVPARSNYFTIVETIFVKGNVVTSQLMNLKNSSSILAKNYSLPIGKKMYKKSLLVAGNINAKNNMLVFSDPFCKYCKIFVPEALKYAKKHPKKIAIFLYSLDIGLSKNSALVSQLIRVARTRGIKDVHLRFYESNLPTKYQISDDVDSLIRDFNALYRLKGSKRIKKSDVTSTMLRELEKEKVVGTILNIQGTPAFFYNGKFLQNRNEYKK